MEKCPWKPKSFRAYTMFDSKNKPIGFSEVLADRGKRVVIIASALTYQEAIWVANQLNEFQV